MTRRTVLGMAAVAALPVGGGRWALPAAAQPSPGTWTYDGNPARTGVFPGPGPDLQQDIVELWRIDGQQMGTIISPSGVNGGLVYYRPVPDGISGDITPLVAIDARTGSEVWSREPPVTNPATFFWGQAAIADDLLVMPTYSGLIVGLDARTGEERWLFDLQGTLANACPAIVDGVLHISDNASVNAIQLGDTPEWLWKSALADGEATVVSPIVSVEGDYLVVSTLTSAPGNDEITSTTIHVLNRADGSEAYRYQFRQTGESRQFAVQDGMLYSRTDTVGWDESYIFSSTIDGAERWSWRTTEGMMPAYPAVSGDWVYSVGETSVWAIDTATGETVWSNRLFNTPLDTDIVVIDDVMYIGSAPPAQSIYAVSVTNGAQLASMTVPFNGARVIGCTDGILIATSGIGLIAFGNPT